MSNTEFVMVPRDMAEEINAVLVFHGYVALPRGLQTALTKPAEQHQGEPVARLVTGPSGVMGAYLNDPRHWAHGYRVEQLYAHADPGWVERLREERDSFQRVGIKALEQLAERDALLAKARLVMSEATYDEGAISAAQFESECAALVAAIDALSASPVPEVKS